MSEATQQLTLTANGNGLVVVASIDTPVTLNTNSDFFLITIFEEAGSTSWTFPILRQIPPVTPASITLTKDDKAWASLSWKDDGPPVQAQVSTLPDASPTSLPAATSTAPTSSATSTAPTSSATTTSTTAKSTSTTKTSSLSTNAESTSTNSWPRTGGDTAGLAIGCFFAGGLAVFVFLALCRRRRKNSHAPKPPNGTCLELNPPVDPQLVPNRNLRGDASSLEDAIGSYVDSYFPPEKIGQSFSRDHDANLKEWAAHEENWHELLLERETQPDACRMFIARVLSARIDRRGKRSTTLLPVKAFDCYQSHLTEPQSSHYQGQTFPDSKEVCTNLTVNDAVAAEAHYSAWREVQARGCWHRDDEDVRNRAVDNTVKAIQDALNPLRRLHRDHRPHEQIALRKLVVMAADYGQCLLFENQITELFWSGSHHGREVFPGVRRIMTPDGRVKVIRQPSYRA